MGLNIYRHDMGRPHAATSTGLRKFITNPLKHSVGARLVTVAGVCRRLSSVGVCNTPRRPAGGFNSAGQAMTSRRLQSNYSSTVARRASRATSR